MVDRIEISINLNGLESIQNGFYFLGGQWMEKRMCVCLHIMPRANEFTRFVSNPWHGFEIALILFFYMKFTLKLCCKWPLEQTKRQERKKMRAATTAAKLCFQFNQQWHKREKKSGHDMKKMLWGKFTEMEPLTPTVLLNISVTCVVHSRIWMNRIVCVRLNSETSAHACDEKGSQNTSQRIKLVSERTK